MGFPGGSINKESACKAGGMGSIPWRRAWQPAPVFSPGESHGQRPAGQSMVLIEAVTTKRLKQTK